MQPAVTSRASLIRLITIGALACLVLSASSPCPWMMAPSAPKCCKNHRGAPSPEHCKRQTIPSNCAAEPKTVAVITANDWNGVGAESPAPDHLSICVFQVADLSAAGYHPSCFLQNSVLRI
jgi:hypothetical protein